MPQRTDAAEQEPSMRIALVSVSVVAMIATAVSFLCLERPAPTQPIMPGANPEATKMLGRQPVAYVPNLGQWEHDARYVARLGATTVFLQDNGWTVTLVERTPSPTRVAGEREAEATGENAAARGVAVRMTFSGADGHPAGLRLFAQFLWLGPAAPLPCPPQGVSASNALDFTIQP